MSRTTVRIAVSPDGRVRGIYTDAPDFVRLMEALGRTRISRASHVEPTPDNRWTADMRPMDGETVLGPFDRRDEALAAEIAWLKTHLKLEEAA